MADRPRHSGPLRHLSVIDMSEGIAGPFCGKMLADLGADVIRIEPSSESDASRKAGPFPDGSADGDASGTYYFTNTSKSSLVLDLTKPRGRDILLSLTRSHDIVIASRTESQLGGMGLSYIDFETANPATILTTVTGFGSFGPYSDFETTHLINCALGGWAVTCGLPDREPLQAGGNVTDFLAGAYGTVGTLAAVQARRQNGRGQHVDVSAMEATITAALLPTMIWEYAGRLPERKSSRTTGPSWIFPCVDGYIGANVLTQPQWEAMCAFVGMPELIENPAYATAADRLELSDDIANLLAPWFARRRKADIFHEAQLWRLPFGLVPSLHEILELEQHRARRFFVSLEHPTDDTRRILVPGLPFHLPAAPTQPRRPPRRGEHTEDVLQTLLGMSDDEVAHLRAEGVC